MMRLNKRLHSFPINLIVSILLVTALIAIVFWAISRSSLHQPTHREDDSIFELSDLLSQPSTSDDQVFQKAIVPKTFNFPEDHLAHPGFRSEWWYFTGHLSAPHSAQTKFGYQFTLFRQAVVPPQARLPQELSSQELSPQELSPQELSPQAATPQTSPTQSAAPPSSAVQPSVPSSNPWRTPQLYMAHFAITNIDSNEHRATEKISRAGPGLAGTSSEPLALWIENWRLETLQPGQLFPLRIVAKASAHKIKLTLILKPDKPLTLQGNKGLSQKSPEAGNASYYYSYTRLSSSGHIGWDNHTTAVEGRSWFDHEWSTSALNSHQQGWDWFSLQLENGYDLMYFRIRSHHKQSATQSISLVDPSGNRIPVDISSVNLTELSLWTSPNGKQYPAKWLLALPEHQIKLTLTPLVADQEMRLSVNYWEGAVNVEGSHQGQGYVELTGY